MQIILSEEEIIRILCDTFKVTEQNVNIYAKETTGQINAGIYVVDTFEFKKV